MKSENQRFTVLAYPPEYLKRIHPNTKRSFELWTQGGTTNQMVLYRSGNGHLSQDALVALSTLMDIGHGILLRIQPGSWMRNIGIVKDVLASFIPTNAAEREQKKARRSAIKTLHHAGFLIEVQRLPS